MNKLTFIVQFQLILLEFEQVALQLFSNRMQRVDFKRDFLDFVVHKRATDMKVLLIQKNLTFLSP